MSTGNGLPPGTSSRDLHNHIDGPEASPANCEESCAYSHLNEFWLADEDKFYCKMCIEEYWLEELFLLVIVSIDPDGKLGDDFAYWEKLAITAECDEDEVFTGFTVKHPDPLAKQEISLKQLEQIRKEIKERTKEITK